MHLISPQLPWSWRKGTISSEVHILMLSLEPGNILTHSRHISETKEEISGSRTATEGSGTRGTGNTCWSEVYTSVMSTFFGCMLHISVLKDTEDSSCGLYPHWQYSRAHGKKTASLRPALAIWQAPSQPGLYSKTLSQTKQNKSLWKSGKQIVELT